MRHTVLVLALLALVACPAFAEGAAKPKPAEPGTSVEMPFLIVPMSKDGKLLGYAYISSKLICSSPAATVAVRGKLAFIQDANVRDVNAKPAARADDPTKIDDDVLSQRLADNARRFVGAGQVVRMVFVQVQFAPLHPSQSTLGLLSSSDQASAMAQTAAAGENQPATASAQAPAATSEQSAATSKPPAGPAH